MRIVICFLCFITALAAEENLKQSIHIGMVADGPSETLEGISAIFKKEIRDLLSREYQVHFIDSSGDWTLNEINAKIENAMNSKTIDVMVAIGPIASNHLALHSPHLKPSFAPFIMDPVLQSLPAEGGRSGIHNLNYLTFPTDVKRDLRVFQQLKPFEKITFLTFGALSNAIPVLNSGLHQIGKDLGIQVQLVSASSSIPEVIEAIKNSEAIYLLPLLQFSKLEIKQLIEAINGQKIATFALTGRSWVEAGVLATMTPDSDLKRLGRRLALNIQRTLLGEDPGSFSTSVPTGELLSLNLETACIVDAIPSWDLLLDAEVVKERDISPKSPLKLLDAVDEAVYANASLAAAQNAVASGSEDVNKAFAPLLPQVEIKTFGRVIDKERAEKSLGWEPQRAVYGSASATQVVYSNKLLGNYCIEQAKQRARQDRYDAVYLDTILDVTTAYFNLLRALTLQDIQLANLRRTRCNLMTARQRVSVGQARSSEVFRWESEVATNRANAVRAAYQVRSSRVVLNKILNRDQACPLSVESVSLNAPFWVLDGNWFDCHIADAKTVEALSDFSVFEGHRLSPAIHEMKNLIKAQATALGVADRAFYTPDVGVLAEVRDRWAEGGQGVNGPLATNGKDWVLAFSVNFPLYTGGARCADKRKAYDELLRLSSELTAIELAIEQAIRIGINNASGSFAAIGLSQESATAARKNLLLVTDAYSKGIATIVDLLDAQNQALIAELVSANAEYDFLIDLVRLQRAVGRFDFLADEEERANILCRLNDFIAEHRKDYPCVASP
jgi:outer membrane protein